MTESETTNIPPAPNGEQLEALVAAINRLADTIEKVRPFLADLSESLLVEGQAE